VSLGSKFDYAYAGNLRLSKLCNALKGFVLPRGGRLPYFPRRYSIEPTTICNLRCPYCLHAAYDERLYVKREMLSYEKFKVLFDKISPYALLVEFYNFGEPFLNKNTPAMIAAASRAGIRSRVSSNMNAPMSDEYARQIVEAGLYRLTCSIDGPTQQVYEQYRAGGRLEAALENAGRIQFYKKKLGKRRPLVVYRMLLFEWNHTFVAEARSQAAHYGFDAFYADEGSFTLDGKTVIWDKARTAWRAKTPKFLSHVPEKAPQPCEWLFTGMIINSNGRAMPCCYCNTLESEHLSLLDHSLDEVWNSRAYINTRLYTLGLSIDRDAVLPVCRHCRLL
jgi:MoaA/NifB/PqqE/SkfB family radical SAM enzyme